MLVVGAFGNGVIIHDTVGDPFVEVFELFSEFVGSRFNTSHFKFIDKAIKVSVIKLVNY